MSKSLAFYNARAQRYYQQKGFAPERKEKMQQAALDLLITLTPPHSTILELGAGTGLFTEQLLQANHFREIYVTDGASAMLALARQAWNQHTPRFISSISISLPIGRANSYKPASMPSPALWPCTTPPTSSDSFSRYLPCSSPGES